ncbi:MAG: hypothetical protein AAB426_10295 [Myxococcota bacterium]
MALLPLRRVRMFSLALAALAVVACSHQKDGPKPTLSGLEPGIVCVEQLTTDVVVSGTNLSPEVNDGLTNDPQLVLPSLTLLPEAALAGGSLAATSVHWVSDSEMRMTIDPALGLTPGLWGLRVENANGNQATLASALLAVGRPVLDAVVPDLACVEQGARSVVLQGSGFLTLGAAVPEVAVGDVLLTPTATGGCVALPGPVANVTSCTSLTVLIPETLPVGEHAVVVTNPAPADCFSTEARSFFSVPVPTLVSIEPLALCTAEGDTTLAVVGSDLLIIDGTLPVLVLANAQGDLVTLTPLATEVSGCVAFTGPIETVSRCDGFIVTLAQEQIASVYQQLFARIENPMPAGGVSTALTIESFPQPQIDAVAPLAACQGSPSLTLTGAGFHEGMRVELNDAGGGAVADVVTVSAGGMSATAQFMWVPAGTYNVSAYNPGGCSDTFATSIAVELGPVAFFADPSTVYSGIDTRLAIYAAEFAPAQRPLAVSIAPTGGGDAIALASVDDGDLTKIMATVPSGVASGTYDVRVDGTGGQCARAVLLAGLTVVDELNIDLLTVSPGFGWTSSATAVTLTTDGGMLSTPRVFLSPTTVPSAAAVALQAVTFVDATTLTALIPAGLPADMYNVIIVNPDGAVGVSEFDTEQFRVTADPPPTISMVTPGSVPNGVQTIDIAGANFRAPAVSLECHIDGGTLSLLDATVDSSSDTLITADVDFGTMADAFCIVRVTDTDNDTFADFSALKVTNLAEKLFPFALGPDLNIARRALSGAAGRVSSAARYLYAIGGDDGIPVDDGGGTMLVSNIYNTVEASAVDIYGVPRPFAVLEQTLTTPRALAGAVTIGRFIYVIGGSADGASSLATVERAYILSPDERPVVKNMALSIGATGPGAGVWYYKLAAVMDAVDAFNPGGETLPSEAVVVRLPNLHGYAVQVTLDWDKVDGAVGYRIYRSPVAGTAAGAEELLVELGDVDTFTDVGGVTDPAELPLRTGSLGVWHIPEDGGGNPLALDTARRGAGITFAMNPNGTDAHLYVVGGRTDLADAAEYASDYEMAVIHIAGDNSQTVLHNFAIGDEALAAGRWMLGAYWANPENASNVGTTHYIYAGGGATGAAGTLVNDVDAATIDWASGGVLLAWDPLTAGSNMVNHAGYGALVANNYLYAFGGKANAASDIVSQALICAAGTTGCGGNVAPILKNWTNASEHMVRARYLLGTALESAFFYMLGGASVDPATLDPIPATTTTEMTVW